MNDVLKEYKFKIRAVIKKITGSYDEDLEQEVYLKIFENMPEKYEEKGKFGAWIKVVTSNVCFDYFKTGRYKSKAAEQGEIPMDDMPDDAPNQEEALSSKQRQRIILREISKLPPKMRKVIELYEFEELSYEEIAKKTGTSVGTVKSRLFNARKILEQKLSFLMESK
jgi:RNA polymerase sigma-70 factor (ECF subfamily)